MGTELAFLFSYVKFTHILSFRWFACTAFDVLDDLRCADLEVGRGIGKL